MNEYEVTVWERVVHTIRVTATDEKTAWDTAHEQYTNGSEETLVSANVISHDIESDGMDSKNVEDVS